MSNGLDSPLCAGALAGAASSAVSRRHCETSGFPAAAAPTGNYGIDVNIDTGLLGLSSASLLSAVQNLFVTPLWMAVVWAVHALVVMLQWAFTIDLLDSGAAGGLGRGLRQAQAALTFPWLAVALSVTSVLALYNGMVRRRVSDTLGQMLLTAAMVVGGMWVISDPVGTVGSLAALANQTSLGTLAVVAGGEPSNAGGVLGDGLDAVFATVVEGPWCYLEFGDVGWCRDPARLDRRLRAAALPIADGELALIGCNQRTSLFGVCVPPGSAQAKTLEASARLLREAQSNGAFFLALPANGPTRNSISESGSLLRAICQSSDATACHGAAAAQAEFRTQSGTWPRVGGLLLILAGALGLLLLLGFIVLRLLAAALFSLLFLLLTPGVVLAPAFGEAGRALFRRWARELLAAVVSKLLFSFLLGAVLAVGAIVSSFTALGWWTRWLLMSAFWWSAYTRRHQALGLVRGEVAHRPLRERRSLGRRLAGVTETPVRAIRAARAVGARLSEPGLEAQLRAPRDPTQRPAMNGRGPASADEQSQRLLASEEREQRERVREAPAVGGRLVTLRAQSERVGLQQEDAAASGNRRRALTLAHRGRRVQAQIAREERMLASQRGAAGARGGGASARSRGERLSERAAFLDDQARLPGALAGAGPGVRDYASLAGLVGIGHDEYARLDRSGQRVARLRIDRELALRADLFVAMGEPGALRRGRGRAPSAPAERGTAAGVAAAEELPVVRDLREVAAGRKRYIGFDQE